MSNLKLVIEKGPRQGETLEYNSRSVIKIGRVARGNTFAIKDDGISSKHICIRFDNDKWNLSDLDSSNGTVLNGKSLEPLLPCGLNDGDCIKIGELTSIVVRIESIVSESDRKTRPRRLGKCGVNDEVKSELGLGLGLGLGEGDLGKSGVEGVEKRNVRGRPKKIVEDSMESGLSCRRNLRSSRNNIGDNLDLDGNDVREVKKVARGGRKKKEVLVDESVIEGKEVAEEVGELREDGNEKVLVKDDAREVKKATRGRKKKEVSVDKSLGDGNEVAEVLEESRQDGYEEGLVKDDVREPKKTSRGRKKNEVLVDKKLGEGTEVAEALEESRQDGYEEGLVKDDEREVTKATRGRKKKEVLVHESLPEGKEVAEELEESGQDGFEAVVVDDSLLQRRENGSDEGLVKAASDLKWQEFEKMTVGDFFDYLEEQLPKEIREASEKTMLELADKTRKCYELNVLEL